MENFARRYQAAKAATEECCANAKRKIQVEAHAFMAAANVLGIQRTFTRAGQCLLYMGESEERLLARRVVFASTIPTGQDGDVVVVCMRYVRKHAHNHRACYHIFVVTPHEWEHREALSILETWEGN